MSVGISHGLAAANKETSARRKSMSARHIHRPYITTLESPAEIDRDNMAIMLFSATSANKDFLGSAHCMPSFSEIYVLRMANAGAINNIAPTQHRPSLNSAALYDEAIIAVASIHLNIVYAEIFTS